MPLCGLNGVHSGKLVTATAHRCSHCAICRVPAPPSDSGIQPDPTCGPTNYSFCTGDGLTSNFATSDGDLGGANDAFIMSIPQSMATVTDGSSNSAAGSEQLLRTTTTTQSSLTPLPSDTRRAFALDPTGGSTQAVCAPPWAGSLTRGSPGGRTPSPRCRRRVPHRSGPAGPREKRNSTP